MVSSTRHQVLSVLPSSPLSYHSFLFPEGWIGKPNVLGPHPHFYTPCSGPLYLPALHRVPCFLPGSSFQNAYCIKLPHSIQCKVLSLAFKAPHDLPPNQFPPKLNHWRIYTSFNLLTPKQHGEMETLELRCRQWIIGLHFPRTRKLDYA